MKPPPAGRLRRATPSSSLQHRHKTDIPTYPVLSRSGHNNAGRLVRDTVGSLRLVDLEVGAGVAEQAAVGVLTRAFRVELVDRVIDQYWRREQRSRALPARLVFYFTLVLCLFPAESYRSAMKILMSVFGRGMRGYRVTTTGSIGVGRRSLGSGCFPPSATSAS